MTKRSVALLALLATIVTILVIGFIGVASGDGEGGVIEIDECTVIDEPGEYELVADIDGDGSEDCIEIRGTSGVVLSGNNFTISSVDNGISIHESNNVIVQDVSLGEIGGDREPWRYDGIRVVGSEEVIIDGNIVTNSSAVAVTVRHSVQVTITSNLGKYTEAEGVNIHHSTDIEVRNNSLIDILDDSGITIHNSTTVSAEDNYLENHLYGIPIGGGSSDIVVRNNTFLDSTLCAMDVKDGTRNVLIEENHMKDFGGVGIVGDLRNITVRNNTLENTHPGQSGIWIVNNVSDVAVYGNAIRNSGLHGIETHRDVSNITIRNNSIEKSAALGLGVQNNATDVTIEDNSISQNRIGIDISQSADIVVQHNLFEQNDDYGVDIRGSTNLLIHHNSIVDNGDGVRVDDESSSVNLTLNWWGAPSGPSGDGPGDGDAVRGDAEFEPWLAPELRVIDASLSASTVDVGETVEISVLVENTGDWDGARMVELGIDGEVVATEEIVLAVGETVEVTFSHQFEEPGEFTVSVAGVEVGTVSVQEEPENDRDPDDADPPENDEPGDADPTDDEDPPDDDAIPGFGVIVAVLGLVAVAVLLRYT